MGSSGNKYPKRILFRSATFSPRNRASSLQLGLVTDDVKIGILTSKLVSTQSSCPCCNKLFGVWGVQVLSSNSARSLIVWKSLDFNHSFKFKSAIEAVIPKRQQVVRNLNLAAVAQKYRIMYYTKLVQTRDWACEYSDCDVIGHQGLKNSAILEGRGQNANFEARFCGEQIAE